MPDPAPSMTPGTYLRLRREAAGFSRHDVALRVGTLPRISAIERAEWLAGIEADLVPIGLATGIALHGVYRFDADVLERLIAIHAGTAAAKTSPPICRSCGCTWFDACHTPFGGCAWADDSEELCTACAANPLRVVHVQPKRVAA